MRTRVSNVKFERGKWYVVRPDIEDCLWMFFTPKRTVKFDTILKHMYKLLNEATYIASTAFSVAFAVKGTTRYAGNPYCTPVPDGAIIEASYIVHYGDSYDGKCNITLHAERV